MRLQAARLRQMTKKAHRGTAGCALRCRFMQWIEVNLVLGRVLFLGRSLLGRYGPLLWIALIFGGAAVFALRQRAELGRIGSTLRNADPAWLAGIVLIEFLILALVALSYQVLLKRFGHQLPWFPLIGVHLQRVVVGTVTPLGGPPSMYVFVRSLVQRGVSAGDALLAITLKSAVGNAAFLVLLLPVLFLQRPSGMLLLGTAALAGLVGAMVGGLALLLRRSRPPGWLTCRLPRRALRFVAQARRHRIHPADLTSPFAILLATKVSGVAMLYVSLQAVGEETGLVTPLLAYTVGMLFLMVAPVFQGIGIVEVSMAVALQRLGIPPAAAIGATLLTRAGELWLPLAMGLLMQAAGVLKTNLPRPALRSVGRPAPATVSSQTPSLKPPRSPYGSG